jgi:prefoldin subunit 5
MMHILNTVLFIVIFSNGKAEHEDNVPDVKRLLLDNPQTVLAQMLSLQRELQKLQTKITEIDVHQSQIQFLNAQVSQLQSENTALKLQISQGSSNPEVQVLKSEVSLLKANLTHVNHDIPLLKTKLDAVMLENHNLAQHSGT